MTARERQRPPETHGEVLCTPPFAEWSDLTAQTAAAVSAWPEPLRVLREQSRAETVAEAERFSAEIGVQVTQPWQGGAIVMTGHQPELYHPGVWVKALLIDRLARESGALGLDLVVDTDAGGPVTLRVPSLAPDPGVREVLLAPGDDAAAYVQRPVPGDVARQAFRSEGFEALGALPVPGPGLHFAAFCDCVERVAERSADLGTLMTAARRCYEASAGTAYLEVQASAQCRTPSYRAFAGALLVDAPRVREVLNTMLGEYRARTGTRSAAQPFPDLAGADDAAEAPFWLLRDGRRHAVSVAADGMLLAGEDAVCPIGGTADSAAQALAGHDLLLAPRALTLTLFQRLFVADLFVHGTGGGRYDEVTDDFIRAYYGVEPPPFAVATTTLLLPLGGHVVTDEDVAAAERRVQRFEHNPDAMLAEAAFGSPTERDRAESLAESKVAAVAAIALPDADRKALGAQIRAINAELGGLLEPVGRALRDQLREVRAEREASIALTDRTYSYCLWDPQEVADTAG